MNHSLPPLAPRDDAVHSVLPPGSNWEHYPSSSALSTMTVAMFPRRQLDVCACLCGGQAATLLKLADRSKVLVYCLLFIIMIPTADTIATNFFSAYIL